MGGAKINDDARRKAGFLVRSSFYLTAPPYGIQTSWEKYRLFASFLTQSIFIPVKFSPTFHPKFKKETQDITYYY